MSDTKSHIKELEEQDVPIRSYTHRDNPYNYKTQKNEYALWYYKNINKHKQSQYYAKKRQLKNDKVLADFLASDESVYSRRVGSNAWNVIVSLTKSIERNNAPVSIMFDNGTIYLRKTNQDV